MTFVCTVFLSLIAISDPHATSHERMKEVLAQIARDTPDQNPWHGDGGAKELRKKLSALPNKGAFGRRWKLSRRLGRHELRLGNTFRAVELHENAYALLVELPDVSPRDWRDTLFELAVANLRLGEDQNCAGSGNADRCIFPIRADGVHRLATGSRRAAEVLRELLDRRPDDLAARWLLNIAQMTLGEYPGEVPEGLVIPPERFESPVEFPEFEDVAPALGLDTFNLSGGAVFEDFDNDHDLDLLTSTFDPTGQIQYYRNDGFRRFTRATEEANLTGLLGGLNLVQADYDNDGFVDVLVLRGAWLGKSGRHPNSLLHNNGDGTFHDVTFAAGLAKENYPSQTAAWADFDNDGDLDLYVGNENIGDRAYPCQLFENNGDGTFRDIATSAGVQNLRYTKGVVWGDYDADRDPDLYVSNLGQENRLYRNDGNGKFTDVAAELGVNGPIRSFPVWFWDYDNDGILDLYVSSYWQEVSSVAASYLGMASKSEPHALYRGLGGASHGQEHRAGFENVAERVGLTRRTAPMGANFGDIDNDGYADFYLGTGYPMYDGLMPNVLYLNRGGKSFVDVSEAARVGHLQKGHAVVFADVDQDGDQDLFEQLGGAYPGDRFSDALFENPGFRHRFLHVELQGIQSNRSAIGAQVKVTTETPWGPRTIHSRVNSGGSFGANPLRCEIGLGKATRIAQLEVFWPTSGITQVFRGIPLDNIVAITEGRDELVVLEDLLQGP